MSWKPLTSQYLSDLLKMLLLLLLSHFSHVPTLCDPIDGSPPGSPVPGILQARTLEWVAISVSNVWKWKVKVKLLSHVWLLATPWTAAYQAPLTMGFSRQEYWSGVPLSSFQARVLEWGETSGVTGKFDLGAQNEAKANRVLPREHTCHSKHPRPTTQETTLHMDISRYKYQNQID